jgi:hypothetical protein
MPRSAPPKRSGHIYCLVNDSFPDQIKIGITQLSIEERMSQLFTTGVPTPFRCHCAKRVANPKKLEQSILRAFEAKRASGREFLRVDPDIIQCVLDLFPGRWIIRDGNPASGSAAPAQTAMM